MRLMISDFKGMAPSLDKKQLGDGYSAVSVNARTGRGMLEPYFASTLVATLQGAAKSFTKHGNIWFSSEETTSVVKAPLKNDPWDYALIAGDGIDPQLTYNLIAESGIGPYPAATQLLGVPKPVAPTIGAVGTADTWHSNSGGIKPAETPLEDEYDDSDVSYSIVYVDAWGRLSAPSAPSAVVPIREWQFTNTNKVPVQLPSDPLTGFIATDAARGTSATIRIYRANYSASGDAVYQFVAEVAHGTSVYYDQKYSGDLQESTVSDGWNPPPSTDTALYPNGTMEKVVIMGTETLVGHNKRLVCFAEPDAIHAWPVEYYKVFSENIVTISPMGSNLAVLTDSHPYVMQGSHPASMEAVRLSDPAPCASKLGVTEVYGSVFFASPLGLYGISGFKLTNLSAPFATEREWKALDPSTMVLANYDGKVFISCPTVGFTYMFDPANPSDALRKVDFAPLAFSQMDNSNDLAYRGTTDGEIYLFDDPVSNAFRLLDWESKTYEFNAPHAFNVVKVRASVYPVTVTIENEKADGSGTRSFTRVLQNELFSYLPDYLGTSREWRIKVGMQNSLEELLIRDIQLAQSPEELT